MSDPFAAIEKLMSMAPINRLQCPQCGNRDELELGYTLNFTSPIFWDGPSKMITADYNKESLRRRIDEFVICVLCTHEFPIPDGWRLAKNTPTMPYYEVLLRSVGDKKIQVIRAIRSITMLGLREAKDMTETLPNVVIAGVTDADAKEAVKRLTEAGATVEKRKVGS